MSPMEENTKNLNNYTKMARERKFKNYFKDSYNIFNNNKF